MQLQEKIVEKIGINSFVLKSIAIITMFIDHIGAVLYPQDLRFRYIGRVAFPIFCFLLVEGFFHTHDRRKYAIRLGIFALISEIPYDLTFCNTLFNFQKQNVFFTLLIGLLALMWIENNSKLENKISGMVIAILAAAILKTDYGYFGILMILSFYLYRSKFISCCLSMIVINWGLMANFQWVASFSMIPIGLYNGKKGPGMKYFFYAFYPIHLLILYFLKVHYLG